MLALSFPAAAFVGSGKDSMSTNLLFINLNLIRENNYHRNKFIWSLATSERGYRREADGAVWRSRAWRGWWYWLGNGSLVRGDVSLQRSRLRAVDSGGWLSGLRPVSGYWRVYWGRMPCLSKDFGARAICRCSGSHGSWSSTARPGSSCSHSR